MENCEYLVVAKPLTFQRLDESEPFSGCFFGKGCAVSECLGELECNCYNFLSLIHK